MKILQITIVFILLFISCKGQTSKIKRDAQLIEQSWFNTDSLLHHVKILSSDDFEGRRTGTDGALKAQNYIIDKFERLNAQPMDSGYKQSFSFKLKGKTFNAENILGVIKGTDFPEKYIVLSAHYDHEGIRNGKIYNGADDDASGISALFAFAEYFKKNPPKHSVVLAAFDAEELGLKGSKYFVENPIVSKEQLVLNINMDMISRNENLELYVVGTRYYNQLKPAVLSYHSSKDMTMLIGHDGSDGKDDWTSSSDHAPFHKANIPFLYFGVEDHEDYHQPTDDFENINPNFYCNAVTAIISVFRELDKLNL